MAAAIIGSSLPTIGAHAAAGDWPTYLGDANRSAFNPSETSLSPASARGMTLKWKFTTGAPIAASATVVNGTVYVGSWDGKEYAIDAATGAQKWQTFLGITTPRSGCSPSPAGITSGATVVGNSVYVGGGDANWYALDANSGAVLWSVPTGDNSAIGGHYNWSSPLILGNFAYVGIASLGDCPLVQGQLLKVDLTTHAIVNTFNVVPNGQVGGGIWTSPAADVASNTIFVTTGTRADAIQTMSEAVVSLDASTLAVKGVWQLPADQAVIDSDWGTTPVLTTDSSSRQLVSAINKNGFAYTFDRNNISPGPLWKYRVAVGGYCPTCGDGSVSSGAFDGSRLYLAGGNEEIGSQGYPGAVQALDPGTGAPIWQHGTTSPVIAAIAAANGLVFDGTGNTLEVLNASSGARLYSYKTGATIFGAPSVSGGQVYVGSVDGGLYAFGLPSSPPPPPPPDPNCPSPWTCQDIGSASPAGSESVSGPTWSVTSSGGGASGTADAIRSIAQPMSGDGAVTGQVTSLPGGSGSQAGLMVRQRSDTGSPYYAVVLKPGGQLMVQHRVGFGGATVVDATTTFAALPLYLQVRRQGDLFQAATSTDGVSYTLVPGSNVYLPLPGASLGGVAVGSGSLGTPGTAGFVNVALGPAGQAASPPPTATACPAAWNCADVGNPAVVGDQSLACGAWTLNGGGADINNYSDEFHFVWQNLAADGTVSARVKTLNGNAGAKAGVMLRQGLAGTSSEYSALVQPNGTLIVQYRLQDGLRTTRPVSNAGSLPAFVQVARSGSTFTAYTSNDGVTYTAVPGSSVSIQMSGSILAGLALTNAANSGSATAAVDSVPGTSQPAVKVVSVDKTVGVTGDTVHVFGCGFATSSGQVPSVTFGSHPSPNVAYVSSTTLTVVAPFNLNGTVSITVTNPAGAGAGSATLPNAFTYNQPPPPPPPAGGTSLYGTLLNGSGSGLVEVHGLSQASHYTQFSLHAATAFSPAGAADWQFFVAGFRGDGQPDLFGVHLRNTASGRVEVHILSAASGYQTFLLHAATALAAVPSGQFQFALGSFAGDHRSDLYVIVLNGTGSNTVEVHVLSEASDFATWVLHSASALPPASPTSWKFLIGDAAASGNLIGILHSPTTGSGHTEVHILSRASSYQNFTLHAATPLGYTDDNQFAYTLGDHDNDGIRDIYAVLMNGSSSGQTEVHALSGAAGYTSFIEQVASGLGPTSTANWQFSTH